MKFKVNGLYFNAISDKEVEVVPRCSFRIKSNNYWNGYYINDLDIPYQVLHKGKKYTVVSIFDFTFRDCDTIRSIHLPNTIKEIGVESFFGCTGFQAELYIPDSVEVIKHGAFGNCGKIKNVYIGKSIKKVEDLAFSALPRNRIHGLNESSVEIGNCVFQKSKET